MGKNEDFLLMQLFTADSSFFEVSFQLIFFLKKDS